MTSTEPVTDALTIAAPIARVWALTVDVEGWPATTPTMTSVERLDDGPLRVGSTARVVQPMQRPTVWTVTDLVPEHRFRWQARVGTVTMTATHTLAEVPGGVRNHLAVSFDGFGAGLARRLLGGRIRSAIATENRGLKEAAEAAVAPS